MNGWVQRDNELIHEHLDDALQIRVEQKAVQKNNSQSKRSTSTTAEFASLDLGERVEKQNTSLSCIACSKTEINLDVLIKHNKHALKCAQNGTQLVYASLEGFVSILSDLGNGYHQGLSDVSLSFKRTHIGPTLLMILQLFNVWKSFATKIAQLGPNNISKNAGQWSSLAAGFRHWHVSSLSRDHSAWMFYSMRECRELISMLFMMDLDPARAKKFRREKGQKLKMSWMSSEIATDAATNAASELLLRTDTN